MSIWDLAIAGLDSAWSELGNRVWYFKISFAFWAIYWSVNRFSLMSIYR